MWGEVFLGYLKRIYKVILWFLTAAVCFGTVFFLYDVPVRAVKYASLLAGAAGLLFLVSDYLHYRSKCKKIEWFLSQEQLIPENLPRPEGFLEQQLLELSRRIYDDKAEQEQRWEESRADMLDYYTLWVHQIKTPISAMGLLLQTENGKHTKELSMELFQIEQYTEMVLQYLRIGSETNDFLLEPCDVDDMIRQGLRKYAKVFIASRLSLDFRETHLRVVTDEKWMVFVIEQLLSNALKYTKKGKISIYSSDGAGVTIEDTGIGIREEDLPRIFEKGYTGFNGRADKKATGLGLYLCRRIADRLGHRITAKSVPGRGSRFTVEFDPSQR